MSEPKLKEVSKKRNPRAGVKRPFYVVLLPNTSGEVDFAAGEAIITRSADETLAIVEQHPGAVYRRLTFKD